MCNFIFQGPNYINAEGDIKSRPSISSRQQLRAMYPKCFAGIGIFKNYKYHIELDKNAKPVVHPVRKISLALIPKLDKELDTMLADGIVMPVEELTDWVNSLVVREKPNGSLRVCLDPKDLNKAIRREHYPVATVDSVTTKLHGSTLFSRLDAKSAYWNVELDEESPYLTTFSTHRGRIRYRRMSYDLNSSQGIFQKRMDQAFERCKGAFLLQMTSRCLTLMSTMTHTCMKQWRVRSVAMKLNFDKCVIKSKSYSFFCNVYSPQGVKPEPKKVETIKKMEAPQTKQELQSFLVMVNYLGQYIKNMAECTVNLRLLLRKDVLFQWTESHEAKFQKLKDSISSDACLMYF